MINKDILAKAKELKLMRDRIKEQGRAGKRKLEREWYRNILFLVGRQWIKWDQMKNKWVSPTFPSWFEMPVTNKVAVCHNTIKTILTQQDPRIIVSPETDSEEAIATAEIADVVVDVIAEETDFKKVKEIASSWVVIAHNVFFHNYYEVNEGKYGSSFVGHEQCAQCKKVYRPNELEKAGGACECGSTEFTPAMDDQGQDIGENVGKGKLCCEAVPPFEMFFNGELQDFKEVTEVVRAKSVPMDVIKDTYPDYKEDSVSESSKDSGIDPFYMKALAYVSTSGGSGDGYGYGAEGGKIDNRIVDYVYSLPCEDFPDGVQATMIGDAVVECDVLQSKTKQDKHFIPFVHDGNERVPGRIWHRGKMDDVVLKQIERNKLHSYILLWIYSMSGGKWLEADGINMTKPTGQPNQVLKYSRGPAGEKPELLNGLQPPANLMQLMEMIDADINDVAAAYDVLKGELPAGLDTASGMRMLMERGFSRHNEMIRNWERAIEDCTIQQIELARIYWTEDRQKTLENDMGSWETKTFNKEDLQGGITIKVEVGSSIPKSHAMEISAIFDSIKSGLINIQDPKVNFKVLEKLGQSDLSSDIGLDIKDAAREWKEFTESGATRYRAGIDNEMIHYADAVARAKSPEFFKMPPEFQTAWMDHVDMHKAALDAQMAQQAAMEAGPQKPTSGKEMVAA